MEKKMVTKFIPPELKARKVLTSAVKLTRVGWGGIIRELLVIILIKAIALSAVIQTAGIWLLKLFVLASTKLQLYQIWAEIIITALAPASWATSICLSMAHPPDPAIIAIDPLSWFFISRQIKLYVRKKKKKGMRRVKNRNIRIDRNTRLQLWLIKAYWESKGDQSIRERVLVSCESRGVNMKRVVSTRIENDKGERCLDTK